MTDDQIEQWIRDLISENMDEENRKAALEWLDKLSDTYQVAAGTSVPRVGMQGAYSSLRNMSDK